MDHVFARNTGPWPWWGGGGVAGLYHTYVFMYIYVYIYISLSLYIYISLSLSLYIYIYSLHGLIYFSPPQYNLFQQFQHNNGNHISLKNLGCCFAKSKLNYKMAAYKRRKWLKRTFANRYAEARGIIFSLNLKKPTNMVTNGPESNAWKRNLYLIIQNLGAVKANMCQRRAFLKKRLNTLKRARSHSKRISEVFERS